MIFSVSLNGHDFGGENCNSQILRFLTFMIFSVSWNGHDFGGGENRTEGSRASPDCNSQILRF